MQSQMMDDSPLESNVLTQSLNSAQKQIEERAYQQRKSLFDYDEILNNQRSIVYFERRQILESALNQKNILAFGEQVISDILVELKNDSSAKSKEQTLQLLEDLLGKRLGITDRINSKLKKDKKYKKDPNRFSKLLNDEYSFDELKLYLVHEFWLTYESKINSLSIYGDEICNNLEQSIILITLDRIWREHLQKMALLREAVGWRGYGQQNPLYEYKQEAFYLFKKQEAILRHVVIYDLLRSSIL